MKKVNIGLLVVVALLGMAGITAFAMMGTGSSAGKYTTFQRAKASGDVVHVAGKWVRRDDAHYYPERDLFQFYLEDSTQQVQLVNYHEPMPVNFMEADKIVVEGKFHQEAFEAEKIFMKCPSKYNDEKITAGEGAASLNGEQ